MTLEQYKTDFKELVAMAEVDVDLFPEEVDGFIAWTRIYAAMRRMERSTEAGRPVDLTREGVAE